MTFFRLFSILFYFAFSTAFGQTDVAPFSGPSPWPEIRKERVQQLLPKAMKDAGIDSWLIICRENHSDPLAKHVGGENAIGMAVILFFLQNESVHSIAFVPQGDVFATKDLGLHDEVIPYGRGANVWEMVKKTFETQNPQKIGINSSSKAIADGLTHFQKQLLDRVLGEEISKKMTSSEEIIVRWLGVKTQREIDIMRKAAILTEKIQIEAYASVIPGKTTDREVANFIKKRMRELGVKDGWEEDLNPNVNSGPDRGHASSTDRVIQPGDFIQTDFGIKVYDMWVTDIQRFAYVLEPGQKAAPTEAIQIWENGRDGGYTAFLQMKPGATGQQVDQAQREFMKSKNSLPVPWSTGHPVGYVAHDMGPSLSSSGRGDALRVLEEGMVFAFDGFYCWEIIADGEKTTKTISVEEMVVITPTGAEYLIPRQMDLILIQAK